MSTHTNIAISPSRIDQVTETAKKLITHFEKDIGTDFSADEFKSVFSPSVQWFDHAFLVQRIGQDAILGLHQAWRHCNQPFRAEVKSIIPTQEGCVLEQVWIGRCTNDIVRPDGEVVVKASGKSYRCHVCMITKISDEGQFERIDEYYNRRWDDGIPEDDYVTMKGASLKT